MRFGETCCHRGGESTRTATIGLGSVDGVSDLLPDRVPERLARCVLGLAMFGGGIGLIIEARLGASPWDVFHQGVSRHTGISVGNVIVITGLLLLLLWIPLRQRPGIGTILNAVE